MNKGALTEGKKVNGAFKSKQMPGMDIWRTRTCCAGKYSRASFQNTRPTKYRTRNTAPAVPHSSCNAASAVAEMNNNSVA